MTKSVLIVGATSDMARATAVRYGAAGWDVWLTTRDVLAAERDVSDIKTRTGAEVRRFPLDILNTGAFQKFIDDLPSIPDTVISFVGVLGDQAKAQSDLAYQSNIMRSNFEGPALLLSLFANRFAERKSGFIVGVSSVAGDRGRQSNYVYGSAKAGFSEFLSGLRNRLQHCGVRVLTVKPGFVNTRMTAEVKLPGVLTAEADEVAKAILLAEEKSKCGTVYVRPVWRLIMRVIKEMPDPVFRRMKL